MCPDYAVFRGLLPVKIKKHLLNQITDASFEEGYQLGRIAAIHQITKSNLVIFNKNNGFGSSLKVGVDPVNPEAIKEALNLCN